MFLGSCGDFQFKRDSATNEIRGYHPSCSLGYPLKKKFLERIQGNSAEEIRLLHAQGYFPTINSKREIKWIKDESKRFVSYPGDSSSSSSSSSQMHSNISPAVNKNLLPLAENPLFVTHPLGFPQGASGSDYSQEYPKWCEQVLSSPAIYGTSYNETVKRCLQRMGLEKARVELSDREKGWKASIDRAVEIILAVSRATPASLEQMSGAIRTIYENVYELIFFPLFNVRNLIDDKHKFICYFQLDFYRQLEGVFQERDEAPFRDIRFTIYESQFDRESEASRSLIRSLQEKNPACAQKIQELAELAKNFVQRKKAALSRTITDYQRKPEILSCWIKIFVACPNLLERYNNRMEGRYFSPSDKSSGFQDHIDEDLFVTVLSALVNACAQFENTPLKEKDEIERLQREIQEGYGLYQHKVDHVIKRIQPLALLKELIDQVLRWPARYEMSDGEKQYLANAVYHLILISNKPLTHQPLIPYMLQSISQQEKDNASRVLASRKSIAEKREACRILYYARIPWKALVAIGSLFHGSGGLVEEEVNRNRNLLKEALVDLYQDFKTLERGIAEFIDFEQDEFSGHPSIQPPLQLPDGCFKHILLLGGQQQVVNNLAEMRKVLEFWNDASLDVSQLNTQKRYAILRTIQMIGEISKNLREVGFLNPSYTAWRCIEKLRDALAHLERFRVNKRLQVLLEKEHLPGCCFPDIVEDFRELSQYFYLRQAALSQPVSWLEIKTQSTSEQCPQPEIKSLRGLLIYLDSYLSIDQQEGLRITVMGGTAIAARREIHQIKGEFLADSYDRDSMEEKINKLPLSSVKRKALISAIRILLNPQSSYKRLSTSRSGSINPKILSTLNKNIQAKNTPQDEVALLKQIVENLKPRQISSESAESDHQIISPRVYDAKAEFLDYLALREERGTNTAELKQVATRFDELTENLEFFIQRKKGEVHEILSSFSTYEDDSGLTYEVTKLIESMESNAIPPDEVDLFIARLGIKESDLWLEVAALYRARLAKKVLPQVEENLDEVSQLDRGKIKRALTSVIDILDLLDEMGGFSDDSGNYLHDKTLHLACQFLYSNLRGYGIFLESNIEFYKAIFFDQRQLIIGIQGVLKRVIDQTNALLHVQTVTEVSTLTSYGQVFVERLNLGIVKELRESLKSLQDLVEKEEGQTG